MEKAYQYHIFSPYRVCPLGAHVDHQHGLVTGFAIDKGVDLWFDPAPLSSPQQGEGHVHLESKTFEGVVDFEIDAPSQVKEGHWGDYARGAKYALRKRFELKRGITGVIQGSLPVGGLSSSAAVLIAYVMAFAKANDITLQPFEVVKIASEAEREYIGLNNGLLDQACIALGKKDGLLFLDCDSNDWRIIKRNPEMPDFEIGIFFSGLVRLFRLRLWPFGLRRGRLAPACAKLHSEQERKENQKRGSSMSHSFFLPCTSGAQASEDNFISVIMVKSIYYTPIRPYFQRKAKGNLLFSLDLPAHSALRGRSVRRAKRGFAGAGRSSGKSCPSPP